MIGEETTQREREKKKETLFFNIYPLSCVGVYVRQTISKERS
jgi:hypothetical protein